MENENPVSKKEKGTCKLFKTVFFISENKYLEIYISINGRMVFRFVTTPKDNNRNGNKTVMISQDDFLLISGLEQQVLKYLDDNEKNPIINILLNKSNNGETRFYTETLNGNPFCSIRYYHRTDGVLLKPTTYGIVMNTKDSLEFYQQKESIEEYITRIGKFKETAPIIFTKLANTFYQLSSEMWNNYSDFTKTHSDGSYSDYGGFCQVYYNEITSKMDNQTIANDILNECKRKNIIPLNHVECIDLIEQIKRREKTNIINRTISSNIDSRIKSKIKK